MSAIVGFITSRLAGPIALGVAVLFLGLLIVARVQLATAIDTIDIISGQLTRTANDLGTCRANGVTLQADLDNQSALVIALKKAGEDATARAEAELATERAKGLRANAAATALLNRRPQGPDICGAALDLVREP